MSALTALATDADADEVEEAALLSFRLLGLPINDAPLGPPRWWGVILITRVDDTAVAVVRRWNKMGSRLQ